METFPNVRVADIPLEEIPADLRWQLFATYYAETHKGAESAIRAGYSQRRAAQTAYDLLKKRHVREYVQNSTGTAQARVALEHREKVGLRTNEASVGEVAWIIEKLAHVVENAPRAGQWAPAVSALQILSRMHLIFREGPTVDARAVNLVLPEGTTLEELKTLRAGFQSVEVTTE